MFVSKLATAALSAWLFTFPSTLPAQQISAAQPTPARVFLTPEAVAAYLGAHQAEWESRLPSSGSVLGNFEPQWKGVRERVDALAAAHSPLKEIFWREADKVAAEPVAPYQSPEEKDPDKKKSVEAGQELWMRPLGDDMVMLALAYKLSGEKKYGRKLKELVLTVCDYPTWGKTGPNDDLTCAHLSRGIAVAYDWNPKLFSPEEQSLIRKTITQRVGALLRGVYGKAFWAANYRENHNQICVSALGQCGLAFYRDIPQAKEWLAAAMLDFENIAKASNADGSSAEGVPYWTYGTSFILEFIENTRQVTGADQFYNAPFLQNAAAYRIGSSTPDMVALTPWGDAPQRDFRGPHHLLYRLAEQYGDAGAAYFADHLPFTPYGVDAIAWSLLWQRSTSAGAAPSKLDYHATVLDMVTTRSGWTKDDYLLAIKSGFTNRNHSHLDAGALIFAWGSDWLLRTPGYGKGNNSPDFWHRSVATGAGRWTFLSNATESESTLVINGKNQKWEPDSRSTITDFVFSDRQCWTSIDLTGVYEDSNSVRREIYHRRGEYILVLDRVQSEQPVQVEWLAQMPPDAQASDKTLTAWSESKGLSIISLGEGGPFGMRTPRSSRLDVPDERQKTYATKAEGKLVNFAILLQPLPARETPRWKASSQVDTEGRNVAQIEGANWRDTVCSSEEPLPISLKGETSRLAVARAIAARQTTGNLTSVLVLGATEVHLPSLVFSSGKPFDLSAERKDHDEWVIDAASDLKGTWVLDAGFGLFDESDKPVAVSSNTSLPAGKYVLRKVPPVS